MIEAQGGGVGRLAIPARLQPFVPAVAVIAVQLVLFPAPAGQWVQGAIIGGLSALVALGMALIYRSNRILNFAQGDLGTVPVVAVVLLVTSAGLPFALAAVIGLLGAVALGALVELVIIRRFFRTPRLVLTVATIGVSQLLAGVALLMPGWWHIRLIAPRLPQPFHFHFEIKPIIFNGSDLLAVIAVPVAVILLGIFLTKTHAGIAIRASAESSERPKSPSATRTSGRTPTTTASTTPPRCGGTRRRPVPTRSGGRRRGCTST